MAMMSLLAEGIGDYFNPAVQIPLLLLLIAVIVFYVIYRRRQM